MLKKVWGKLTYFFLGPFDTDTFVLCPGPKFVYLVVNCHF